MPTRNTPVVGEIGCIAPGERMDTMETMDISVRGCGKK